MADKRKVIASRPNQTLNGSFRIACVHMGPHDTWDSTLSLIESKAELASLYKAVTVMKINHTESLGDATDRSQGSFVEKRKEGTGFEGLAEVVLSMLGRYKIVNLIICILFKDYSILKAVTHSNLEAVCSKLKEFLLEFYSSLIEHDIIRLKTDEITTYRRFDLPLPAETTEQKRARKKRDQDFAFHAPSNQKVESP